MTAVLMTPPYMYFTDDDGAPLAGGLIYTYAAGSYSTPKAAYTTAAGDTEHTNPIELDSSGRAVIFIDGSYNYIVKTAAGVTIRSVPNVTSFTALDSQSDSYQETFSGNGTTTAFTTSEDLGTDEKAIYVWVDQGLQQHVANGTFATDTIWTKGAGWTIAAGVATATGAISTAISQASTVTVLQGQAYIVTMTITRSAGGLIPSIGGTNGTERTSSGTYVETIIAGSTQTISFTGNAFTGTLDTVTVTPAVSKGYQIQPATAFTINGTALTFNTAPATGTGNILVSAPLLAVGSASSSAAAAQAAEAAALAAQTAAEAAQTAAELAETNAETAETNAETAETNAETAATLAQDWAVKTDGQVAATDYSAKAWAIGGTGTTTNNAKYWAEQASVAVTGAVKVSANDTTAGDLESKLLKAGNFLALSTQNDGGNETRTITASINALGTLTLAAADLILVEDADASNAQKKTTVQGILDLVPAATPGWVIIGTAEASGSASLTITGLNSTYDTFAIGISDMVPQTDGAEPYLRLGDSGGIDSGATDYAYHTQRVDPSANTYNALVNTGAAQININGTGVGNAAGEGFGAMLFLHKPGDGTTRPIITGTYAILTGSSVVSGGAIVATRTAVINVDRVQISMSTGNIASGRLTVWGIRHA